MFRRIIFVFSLIVFFSLYFLINPFINFNLERKYQKTDEIIKSYFKDFHSYTSETFLRDLLEYQEAFNKYNSSSPIMFMTVFDKNWKILGSAGFEGALEKEKKEFLEKIMSDEMKNSSSKMLFNEDLFQIPFFLYKQRIHFPNDEEVDLVYAFDALALSQEVSSKRLNSYVVLSLLGLIFYLLYKGLSFFSRKKKKRHSPILPLESLSEKEDKKEFSSKTKKDDFLWSGSSFSEDAPNLSVQNSIEEEALEEVEIDQIGEEFLKQWNFGDKNDELRLGTLADIRKNHVQLKDFVENSDFYSYLTHFKGQSVSLDFYKSLMTRLYKSVYYPNLERMTFYQLSENENVYNERLSLTEDKMIVYNLLATDLDPDSKQNFSFVGSKLSLNFSRIAHELSNGFFYLDSYRNSVYYPIMTNDREKIKGILKIETRGSVWKNQIIATELYLKSLLSM